MTRPSEPARPPQPGDERKGSDSISRTAANSAAKPERVSNAWARYAGLGVQFAATIVVFVALGLWADGRFGTGPWLVLAGVALGFTGALLALIRAVPAARGKSHKSSEPPS